MLLGWTVGVLVSFTLQQVLAQNESPCDPGEVCISSKDPLCQSLVDSFRNGRITRPQLGEKFCGRPSKYCCKKGKTSDMQNVSDGPKSCPANSECKQLSDCNPILSKLRNGEIGVADLQACEGRNNLCCPIQENSSNPRGSSSDPDSPSYIPSADKGECGHFRDLSNIVGGETTKPGRYPFLAVIGVAEGSLVFYKCGGTVINRWFVLTAAHCFYNTGLERGIVNIGDWKIDTKEDCVKGKCLPQNQLINIEKVIKHNNFILSTKKVDNDIALVKLRTMVDYNPFVVPVCLPIGSAFDLDLLNIPNFEDGILGVRAHAIGWGRSQSESEYYGPEVNAGTRTKVETSDQQKVDLPILTETKCKSTWKAVSYERQVCAGGELDKDSCKGDSGGPLVISKFSRRSKNLTPDLDGSKWYLVGLTSYGSRSCGSGRPGVYTRITSYIDWIQSNLK